MISSTYLRVLPAGTARPCRLTTWRGAQPGGHRPSVRAASEPLCLPCSGAQDGGGLDHPSRRQAALGAAAALVWLLSLRQQPAWAESELPQGVAHLMSAIMLGGSPNKRRCCHHAQCCSLPGRRSQAGQRATGGHHQGPHWGGRTGGGSVNWRHGSSSAAAGAPH